MRGQEAIAERLPSMLEVLIKQLSSFENDLEMIYDRLDRFMKRVDGTRPPTPPTKPTVAPPPTPGEPSIRIQLENVLSSINARISEIRDVTCELDTIA